MMVDIGPDERDVLVETLTEWLEGADETEQGYYGDRCIEEPEEFLEVMNDHKYRVDVLERLRERLSNATE